jgi:D-tyrosyl-tRNA(Tyr) deacylase
MATLNADEQAKVDRYNELERAQRYGERPRDAAQLEHARVLAENAQRNAETRERVLAERQAEKAADAAKHQARRDTEVLAAQEAYKQTARVTFPGTPAQFDAAWPELLRAWQIRKTATDMDALVERKRQQMAGML